MDQVKKVEIIVLPVSRTTAEIWEAWTFKRTNDTSSKEEVDLSALFPDGYISYLMSSSQSSGAELPFAYRVFVDSHSGPCPLNQSVKAIFGAPWMGQIVIMKYSRCSGPLMSRRGSYTHLRRNEADYVISEVGQ
jgi:hypothetical protein